MAIASDELFTDCWNVDQHQWARRHPLWRGPFAAAAEDLPINAEAYRDPVDGRIRKAHGGLRRDTPILRIGQSLVSGDICERHWTNGLVVKVRA